MPSRFPPIAALAHAGRTYAVLWRLPKAVGNEFAPLGTVVAPMRVSATYEAGRRWPAARGRLVVRAARSVPTEVLAHALADDARRD